MDIVAILLSPVIALVVGQIISDRKERTRRRHQVFDSLWLTRGHLGTTGRLSLEHVRALNSVEIEFSKTRMDELYGRAERCDAVIEAWRKLQVALNHEAFPLPLSQEALDYFAMLDLLRADLIFEMSGLLGYSFTREQIMAGAYSPKAYDTTDEQAGALRAAAIAVLEGRRPVHITEAPPEPEPAALPKTTPGLALPQGEKPKDNG